MRGDRALIFGLGAAVLGAPALAHEFQLVELSASEDWCAELHASAHPGDVVQLAPGVYPGGCRLRTGGIPEENEALVVQGAPGVVVAADADGLSLRVEGDTTRLYGLHLEGRLEVAADHLTVDSAQLGCLEVAPHVQTFTLLFSEVPSVDLELAGGVVRGNRLVTASVAIGDGLIADNVVFDSLTARAPAHRNAVLGDLDTEVEAFGNVVWGELTGGGLLYGNTLLGGVEGAFDARNNLTLASDLGEGNLHCPACIGPGFDPRPRGEASTWPVEDAPGDIVDFCREPRLTVGALSPSERVGWTVFDRDAIGCVDGGAPLPEAPVGECPEPQVASLSVGEGSRGCATGEAGWGGAPALFAWLWWRNRCRS